MKEGKRTVKNPWDQQKGESEQAFAAFAKYRDMEAKARSVPAAYRQKSGKTEAKQAPGTWNGWAKRRTRLSRKPLKGPHTSKKLPRNVS
jgi:hypothetical protein